MSDLNESHVAIVVAGFEAEKPLSDDEILQQLFEAGVSFSDLRATFNDIIKAKGLRLSSKERKVKTAEFLEGWEPEAEDVEDMLEKLAGLQNMLNVTSTKAMGSLRAWAKDMGITLPKKPKEVKEKKVGFGGFIKTILDHAMANQDCTRDSLVEFCKTNDINEKYATPAFNAVNFARQWNGEVGDTADTAEAA